MLKKYCESEGRGVTGILGEPPRQPQERKPGPLGTKSLRPPDRSIPRVHCTYLASLQPHPPATTKTPLSAACLSQSLSTQSMLASAPPISLRDRAHRLYSLSDHSSGLSWGGYRHPVPSRFGHAHRPSRPRPAGRFRRSRGASPAAGSSTPPLPTALAEANQPRRRTELCKPPGHAHRAPQVSSRSPRQP